MKLKKKISVTTLVLAMLMSLFPMSVFAVENTFTIDDVVYDGTADTTTEYFSTITSITYTDNGVPTTLHVTSDQLATLTVDGVQYDIEEGASFNYGDEAVINITTKDSSIKQTAGGPGIFLVGGLPMETTIDYYFRTAAYISANSFLANYSVLNAIISGTVTDTEATDVVIDSRGDFFNGFVIDSSNYTINNLNMNLLGNGGDDFNGWGAGITVKGTDSVVNIDKAKISSTGAIRTAIWAGGTDSTLNVTNSVITAYNAEKTSKDYLDLVVPMLNKVPWALGLEGNIRATNVLGSATANYSDSIIVSESWGALSTDSGVKGTNALNVDNVLAGIGYLEVAEAGKTYDATKTVDGVTYGLTIANSGYVTYSDQGVENFYNDVEFYAPDYVIILAAKASSATFTGDTVAFTKRFGAMWHQNDKGTLSLTDGSWTTSDIMFLCKSTFGNPANPILNVDGTELNITGTDDYSGVLYQLMESDDAGGPFVSDYTTKAYEADDYVIAEVTEETTDAVANFTDIDVEGDIFNSVITVNQDLDVTLDSSTIKGVISSSTAKHVDEDGNLIGANVKINAADEDAYLYAGRIVNTASDSINNEIYLTLQNGTEWMCEGDSYISSLTIDDTSEITAPFGYEVVFMSEGTEIDVTAGTYTDVEVTIKEIDKTTVTATLGKFAFVITGDSAFLPYGSTGDVSAVTTSSVIEALKKLIGTSGKVAVYDITLFDLNEVEIHQLDGYVSVTLPVPDGMSKTGSFTVYRQNEDGTVTKLETTVKNGEITFKTNHFSRFVVVENAVEVVETGEGITFVVCMFAGTISVIFLIGCGIYYRKKRLSND